MAKTETVYKLMRINKDGQRTSIFAKQQWKVIYKPDKIYKGHKGSSLFAFDTLDNAMLYTQSERYHLEIWECEATGTRFAGVITVEHSRWTRFWELEKRNKALLPTVIALRNSAGTGAVFCKTIKPIECVYHKDKRDFWGS